MEGSATRLCSEGPVPVVRKTAEERAPGGAANTAANLRGLGADVAYLAVIGRDVPGMLLRAALRERGVDGRWLVDDASASTLHKLRILADDSPANAVLATFLKVMSSSGKAGYVPIDADAGKAKVLKLR